MEETIIPTYTYALADTCEPTMTLRWKASTSSIVPDILQQLHKKTWFEDGIMKADTVWINVPIEED